MTPKQLRDYRQELGLSVDDMAEFLCIGPRNFRRFERGVEDVPRWLDRFLPMIVAVKTKYGIRYRELKEMIEQRETAA